MLYWIDDDLELLRLVEMLFGCNGVKVVTHWDNVPEIKSGDLVIYDWDGVGTKPEEIEGVQYYCCSSSTSIEKDFSKPPPWEKIAPIIHQHQAKIMGCELKRRLSVYRHGLANDLCIVRCLLETLPQDNPKIQTIIKRVDKICDKFMEIRNIELGKGVCYKA